MPHQIAVIGAGVMAEAIVRGLLAGGKTPADSIVAADVSAERRNLFESVLGVIAVENPADAVAGAWAVLLSVKPYQMEEVLKSLRGAIDEKTLIVSIAAGIGTGFIEQILGGGKNWRVVRAMPNTPMLVGRGMVAIARGSHADAADLAAAHKIFEPAAKVIEVSEEKLDAVTAVSGSGPAYYFYLTEQLIRAGVELGLSDVEARTLAIQTAAGAAEMMSRLADSPGEHRRRVTTPNGTTHAAISHMDERKWGEITVAAVKAAAKQPGIGQVSEPFIHAEDADALKRLGQTHLQQRNFDLAVQCFRRGIALRPDSPSLWSHLGIALQESGQSKEAIESFRKACALRPEAAELLSNLGNALWQSRQLTEAEAACRRAIELNPALPDAHGNLGNILLDQGRIDEAVESFNKTIQLHPDYAVGHYNLGHALTHAKRPADAAAAYRRAVELQPNFVEALTGLGFMLKNLGKADESLAAFRSAIAAEPGRASLHNNLANALKDVGDLEGAIDALRRAIQLDPQDAGIHGNLIFTLQYVTDDPKVIADELQVWNQRHARPLKALIRPHDNDPSPQRRLKIGYVSPDFHGHPVGRVVLPILAGHDKTRFEIFCYSATVASDQATRQMQNLADGWRDVRGMSDAALAEQIRRDRIDILVDLAMHTGGNRLLAFAQKPAPVQVTYLAYCGSSGLETMDYRLSDPYMDPPGGDETGYTEKTLRLAHTFWCYVPTTAAAPAEEPPASKTGFVTFGCLNNFCKISPPVWTTWFEMLRQVPSSKLFLFCEPGLHRDRARLRMRDAGLDPERMTFTDSTGDYFAKYRQIDVALDPFPYGGGMTTCDAIWMGIPVVTLLGKTGVGRGGTSILSNLGIPELIAQTPADYVRIAVELARDLSRLTDLRRNLRQRMIRSPLMNTRQFAADIESAYETMWQNWVRTRQ